MAQQNWNLPSRNLDQHKKRVSDSEGSASGPHGSLMSTNDPPTWTPPGSPTWTPNLSTSMHALIKREDEDDRATTWASWPHRYSGNDNVASPDHPNTYGPSSRTNRNAGPSMYARGDLKRKQEDLDRQNAALQLEQEETDRQFGVLKRNQEELDRQVAATIGMEGSSAWFSDTEGDPLLARRVLGNEGMAFGEEEEADGGIRLDEDQYRVYLRHGDIREEDAEGGIRLHENQGRSYSGYDNIKLEELSPDDYGNDTDFETYDPWLDSHSADDVKLGRASRQPTWRATAPEPTSPVVDQTFKPRRAAAKARREARKPEREARKKVKQSIHASTDAYKIASLKCQNAAKFLKNNHQDSLPLGPLSGRWQFYSYQYIPKDVHDCHILEFYETNHHQHEEILKCSPGHCPPDSGRCCGRLLIADVNGDVKEAEIVQFQVPAYASKRWHYTRVYDTTRETYSTADFQFLGQGALHLKLERRFLLGEGENMMNFSGIREGPAEDLTIPIAASRP